MASQNQQLHFLLIPLMSQSHIIPLTDFAKLLAQRDLKVTIITTPLNARRCKGIIDRAVKANLKIQLIPLRFPCQEVGLPEGIENMDALTSPDLAIQFFEASGMLQEPLEKLVEKLEPPPSCLICTYAVPWTSQVARKFKIPRYVFNTVSCFTLMCCHNISRTNVLESVTSDSESFLVPDMPHKIEFTKSQLPEITSKISNDWNGIKEQMEQAEKSAQGIILNTFEELEERYVEEYKKVKEKIWCVGPVSVCNKLMSDKFDRGNKASIDGHHCLKWLDSMKPSSVIYTCFGSLCHISPPQLIEIGLGLEASNRPFIWVIRGQDYSAEVENWLAEERFEDRIEGRGLIIRGWAPQVLILSHAAIGGFFTHCGWNSTLEGVCAGVPMITWPMFAEQFYNEKFVSHVLRIGVRIGVDVGMKWKEEEKVEILVKREQVKKAIHHLMDEGEESEERRKRAKKLGEMAKMAMEEDGSSCLNIMFFIQDVIQQINNKGSTTRMELSVMSQSL